MTQCCLNGARTAGVPTTPSELAPEAAAAVAAGATDLHVHPKDAEGRDSLEPDLVAQTLTAIRAEVSVPVGVTTGAWINADPEARLALVDAWEVLPDHASVNWHESGAVELAAALIARGIGVEAGVWTVEAAREFCTADIAGEVLRVLVEVPDAEAAEAVLDALGPVRVPVLLHGEEDGAWPVLRLAVRLGLTTRIGLEDTLLMPDGRRAESNAALVAAAVALGAR